MPTPLKIRDKVFDWKESPFLMGIINVTPDSFSDGGESYTIESAIRKAQELIDAGADIIDVGGESTRPFSEPVPEEEEIKRVIPVIKEIRRSFPEAIISIDTYKASVAERALQVGADIVNDISGGQFDPRMLDVVREYSCPYILMHIKGTPKTMQINPQYTNLLKEIKEYFLQRIEEVERRGISIENIILDPGIGFGKTLEHNIEILRNLHIFHDIGCPILIGPSRKSFIGEIIKKPPKERDGGTAGVAIFALLKGAHILRIHNVALVNDAIKVFKYLWNK